MRDQLLPDKSSKELPRVEELVDEAAAIAAVQSVHHLLHMAAAQITKAIRVASAHI